MKTTSAENAENVVSPPQNTTALRCSPSTWYFGLHSTDSEDIRHPLSAPARITVPRLPGSIPPNPCGFFSEKDWSLFFATHAAYLLVEWPQRPESEVVMPRKSNPSTGHAPKSAKARKKVSNPVSTGGRGGSFERRVQAVRLLAMLLGIPCPGVRDNFAIASLLFQGRVLEHNTDDLVVFTFRPGTGQKSRHNLQMKRSLRATANETFIEAVGLAWLDFKRPAFNRGMDENLIVYDATSATHMRGAVEVVNLAKYTLTADSWVTKVQAEGFSNTANRTAFEAIKTSVEQYSDQTLALDELFQFVVHLSFLSHDLDSDRTSEVATQKQLIRQALPLHDASGVWAQLMAACANLNGLAGEIDLKTAQRHLGDLAEEFRLWKLLQDAMTAAQAGSLVTHPEIQGQLASLAQTLSPLLPDRRPEMNSQVVGQDFPAAQATSVNSVFSRQLDRVKQLHNDRKYREALAHIETLQEDLESFDPHQKARWYFHRGMCYWMLADDTLAASDLQTASELYGEDDRIAAGGIRARLLRNQLSEALELGQALQLRFPTSLAIWQVVTNARVMNREEFTEEDIPSEFRDKSSAWQMLASARASADDDEGAVTAIGIALEQSDASIGILENNLRMVLRLASQNPIHVENRWLPEDRKALLEGAISRFDDRETTLWAEQSTKVQTDIVFHLAYGFLLLAKPAEALSMIEQGRQRRIPDHETSIRIELEALSDLNRQDDVLHRYADQIGSLPTDALAPFGHACLRTNRDNLLQLAIAEIARRIETSAGVSSELLSNVDRVLHHLHWELLLRNNDLQQVSAELSNLGVTPASHNVAHLVFAARAYANDPNARKRYEDKVAELAASDLPPNELALASQLMLATRRFDMAVSMLERLLPTDSFTPLHVDLAYAYAALDQRAALKEMLASLSAEWRSSADMRRIALQIYSTAGDWRRMLELAQLSVTENPDDAALWLTLIQVNSNLSVDRMQACIETLPRSLKGSTADQLRIGGVEISSGRYDSGIDRIYRVIRCDLGDLEAAALHMTLVIMASDSTDAAFQAPDFIEPGTSVELEDEHGGCGWISIDLDNQGSLPATVEFVSPTSPQASSLMGLKVGQTVTFRHLIGEQVLTVKRLCSIHQRLFDLSNQRVSGSIIPSETLTSMPIPRDEKGDIDLSFFIQDLEHRKAHGQETLRLYGQHVATLGLVAQLIGGVDLFDLIRGWPIDGPALEVTFERLATLHPFNDVPEDFMWVIDLSMLVELATLGLLDVLEQLPRVYLSSTAKLALDVKIEKASRFRAGGTMFSHEGKIGYQEQTREQWGKELEFFRSIELAIDSYCEVVPAYGPKSINQLPMLHDILADEEYATLLVCKEYGAGLLSLDGRMRNLAQTMEIPTASPQMLLAYNVQRGELARAEYSRAVIKMIMARRNFVGVEANDLVSMMDQGPEFAALGMNSLKDYLASPALACDSVERVIIDFISHMYNSSRCDVGVMLQLVFCCFEGMFRHPKCPGDWERRGYLNLEFKLAPAQLNSLTYDAIRLSIGRAREQAQRVPKPFALNAQVNYGQRLPFYKTIKSDELALQLLQSACAEAVLPTDGGETHASPARDS